jgi:preprotein translocase subunit SecB
LHHSMKFANFNLLHVTFHLNEKFNDKEKEEAFLPEIAIDNIVTKKSKEMAVLMGVRKTDGNVPYYFEVRAGGLFKFDKLPGQKILKQFASVNCPAIIFPFIRETIADLTRRAGFPPLHLDPINFIELANLSKEKKKPQKSDKSKQPSKGG